MTGSPHTATWTTQQLVAFLAQVSTARDAGSAAVAAAEAVAVATEAEVGAVVIGSRVVASVGFPPGQVPDDELVACCLGDRGTIRLADGARAPVEVAQIGRITGGYLLSARVDGEFEAAERGMLRAMGTVLGLTLDLLDTLAAERVSRSGQEVKTRQVSQLLAHARMQRQVTLERISGIQRAIASRRDLPVVLEAITQAACELLDSPMAVLKATHPVTGDVLISAQGLNGADPERVVAAADELLGKAATPGPSQPTALIDNNLGRNGPDTLFAAEGVQALMSLPVILGGESVGGLLLGSRDPRRSYGPMDQTLATTLVEHAVLAVQDAGTVEALQQSLRYAQHQASHDSLTGLSNRDNFLEDLDSCLASPAPAGIAVLFIDLDHFKAVNDSRGHTAGDRLLSLAAHRLLSAVRPGDHVARMGGDEFAILIRDVPDEHRAAEVAQRVYDTVCERADIFGADLRISASIGVALPHPGENSTSLLARADLALYQAKRLGRGRVCLFDPVLADDVLARVDTETQLHRGLGKGEIVVHLQPIVDLRTGRPVGLEALARWQHPERGLVPPAEFIPVAEESGMIVELGRQVLTGACQAAARLRARTGLPLRININLSPRQIEDQQLPAMLRRTLAETGLPPGDVTLEVTESLLLADGDQVEAAVAGLIDTGVRLALDDFGTGYSSLSTLRRLPMHSLKIDRSFVAQLGSPVPNLARPSRAVRGADEAQLVQAVISLGQSLGMSVVAEGVETEQQREQLLAMGCTLAQGYLLARPMSEAAVLEWLLSDGWSRQAAGPTPRQRRGSDPQPAAGTVGG